jgi:lipid II:glycine glycyltransferase (peptidoglycan interpeptide bridge formation enzyme)
MTASDHLVVEDATGDEWDGFLAIHPDGHHEQSSGFAKMRAAWGFVCDRVVVRSGSRVIGGAQILSRRTPVGTQAYLHRGPLALADEPDVLDKVLGGLKELAKRRAFVSVRAETFATQEAARRALSRAGYTASQAWYGPRPSILAPLKYSDEELLSRMKPKGRYNVRLAERAGVVVKTGDGRSLADFYALHLATAAHQGFPTFPFEYFTYVWQLFSPGKKMQLFVASLSGRPIAAILNTVVSNRSYYGWGGMDRSWQCRKAMPNYLLHFAAMRWARQQGHAYYDLVGVTEFKEKLGGDQIFWPLPQTNYFGSCAKLRRSITELAWSIPALRRTTERLERHMLNRKPMPH